ncbi:MAG: hypothetical protein HYX20_01950 [Candidatus Yanofskybacteria bacterium]|nr:hypothetical protein [Candidatus Yanofskybacteria bacterium]
MKKLFSRLATILICNFLASSLWATEVPIVINGRILAIEPSKSVTVEIKKSKGIEFSLTEIKTLAVLDPKELTDNVGTAAVIGGMGGGVGASVGVVNPPKSLQRSRLKDAGLVGLVAAGFSAIAMAVYNFFTQRSPMLVYDIENEGLNNIAVISHLPIGTRIRITQKNHINGTH